MKKEFRVDAKLHFVATIWAEDEEEAEQKFLDDFTDWPGELFGSDFDIEER